MTHNKLGELAEYYDSHDTSEDLERAELEEDVDPDPMVTTSVRLPKSLLDWVRGQAEAERVKTTALIRRWIEERRGADGGDEGGLPSLVERVQRLESKMDLAMGIGTKRFVAECKSLTEALQESVQRASSGREYVEKMPVILFSALPADAEPPEQRTPGGR